MLVIPDRLDAVDRAFSASKLPRRRNRLRISLSIPTTRHAFLREMLDRFRADQARGTGDDNLAHRRKSAVVPAYASPRIQVIRHRLAATRAAGILPIACAALARAALAFLFAFTRKQMCRAWLISGKVKVIRQALNFGTKFATTRCASSPRAPPCPEKAKRYGRHRPGRAGSDRGGRSVRRAASRADRDRPDIPAPRSADRFRRACARSISPGLLPGTKSDSRAMRKLLCSIVRRHAAFVAKSEMRRVPTADLAPIRANSV